MKLRMAFKNYCSQVPSIWGGGWFSGCHGTNNAHAGCFQRMQEDGRLLDPVFPKLGYPRDLGKGGRKEIGVLDGYRCRHRIWNCNTHEILCSAISRKTPMLEQGKPHPTKNGMLSRWQKWPTATFSGTEKVLDTSPIEQWSSVFLMLWCCDPFIQFLLLRWLPHY